MGKVVESSESVITRPQLIVESCFHLGVFLRHLSSQGGRQGGGLPVEQQRLHTLRLNIEWLVMLPKALDGRSPTQTFSKKSKGKKENSKGRTEGGMKEKREEGTGRTYLL